jgi:hypothetical protein
LPIRRSKPTVVVAGIDESLAHLQRCGGVERGVRMVGVEIVLPAATVEGCIMSYTIRELPFDVRRMAAELERMLGTYAERWNPRP